MLRVIARGLRRPGRRVLLLFLGLAGGLCPACVTTPRPAASLVDGTPAPMTDSAAHRFDQGRDTFAFTNLVRAERPGLNDGFANYCLIMARAASQFFRAARFAPARPVVPAAEYTRLVREVLGTASWAEPRSAPARIVIPGYPDLRTFSRGEEAAIKTAFGSNVLSMVDWRTWRVGVAFSSAHQARLADELLAEVEAGRPAPVMITNFPTDDILNHAVLVYGRRPASPVTLGSASAVIELLAYDPNDADTPLGLFFDRATRGFWVPPLPYSPPGRIRAFRLYTGYLF